MLTNEKIAAIHANAVAHGFWEPGEEPTFGEYCAFIHEEISEAFSAWRNGEPDEYVKDGKPEGVWVEMADVVIRCADAMAAWGYTFVAPDIQFVPANRTFAELITVLHSIVSDMINFESESLIERRLRVIVAVVYIIAECHNIDLDAVIDRKCAYNATRPYKHGKRM